MIISKFKDNTMNRENGKKRVLLSILIIILVFCLTAIIIIGIIYAPKKDDPSGGIPGDGSEDVGGNGDDSNGGSDGDHSGDTVDDDIDPVSGLKFMITQESGREETYMVHSIGTATGNVTVPETFRGIPVTSIGNSAFKDCPQLTGITIANSVTVLGHSVFENCVNLTAVELPDSITAAGNFLFEGCTGLTSLKIGSGLTSLTDSQSVECVRWGLQTCINLTEFTVSEQNTAYRTENLCLIEKNTNKLVMSCARSVIPYGVIKIGRYAFDRCQSENVNIPVTVEKLEDYAFYESKITEMRLSDNVTSIGTAFSYCKFLQTVEICGVTEIESDAFSNCTSLTFIIVSQNLAKINRYAFSNSQASLLVLFRGTQSQWDTLQKDESWDEGLANITIEYDES